MKTLLLMLSTILTFVLNAKDPDSDPITLTALSMPEGATFVDNHNGTGAFSFKPSYSQAGAYTVSFIAAAKSLADSEQVKIIVIDVNTAPMLAEVPEQKANEAQTLAFTVSGTDREGTAPTISASPVPTGAPIIAGMAGPGVDERLPC